MLLRGKRIVVIGAASGIGLGSARLFAREGAEVGVADLDAASLARVWSDLSSDRRVQVDVTSEDDCERLMEQTAASLGGLDGVLHCAGISDVVAPALELCVEQWQRIVDVNLRGTFLVCRAAGRLLVEQGSGSIVTTASVNGINGIPRRHAYGPAKAAVAQLTRTLACEWGASQVRVNALAPTYVATPMIDRLVAEGKIDLDRLKRRTPMGRIATVDDVGRAAAFLLSDWSSYITGVVLPVDGGWTAYGGPGDVATA
jgi:NAD(P)-dependent dehydrogenase (short-subunit alcohol dehydrogenase family)